MIFLQAMWHSVKVISVALYWLLMVCFVWAGFAQLGSEPRWAWGCFACVLGVFAGRGLLINRRLVSPAQGYVLGCGVFLVFMLVAGYVTGYLGAVGHG